MTREKLLARKLAKTYVAGGGTPYDFTLCVLETIHTVRQWAVEAWEESQDVRTLREKLLRLGTEEVTEEEDRDSLLSS